MRGKEIKINEAVMKNENKDQRVENLKFLLL